jgi:CarboxypepD_reg-like domain/TonB-dependent Receptor Plug Domain
MHVRVAATLLLLCALLPAAEIRGKVVSVVGAEPLGRVQVAVLETGVEAVTANDGSFVIRDVAAGTYTLRLNAVGFRLVTVPFSLTAQEEAKEFDITLVPDNFRLTEKVEVKGDIFQGPESPAVVETNLTSSEIRETSTVLADDPFRAIQALPGVSASGNNDFFAQFSVMGASYNSTSTYIDGILVPNPFHGSNVNEGATLSILTTETIEDIKLLPAAYPEKYGDAVGAALDLQTRDGSRTSPIFRASVGLADTELLGEGELGNEKRGSWLASARKSYLGYLLRSRLNDTFDDISFYDGDLKLTYDVTPHQAVSFYGVGGHTLVDRVHTTYTLTPDDTKTGTNDFVMARVGWRWALSPHTLLDTRAAYLEAPYTTLNMSHQVLDNNHHGEWVAGSSVVWSWRKDEVLEGGWMSRRVNNTVASTYYDPKGVASTGVQSGAGWKSDGYIQQTASFLRNRLHIVGGLRLDTADRFDIHPVSPQISASLQIASATQLQLGAGRYNQFDFPANAPIQVQGCAISDEFLQSANHFTAGVEQRIGESARVKVLLFDRQNHVSLDSSFFDPFTHTCSPQQGFATSERDYSRGAQIVLQSRTANRLSGWIGYTLTYARQAYLASSNQGLVWRPYFPTLEDQRHALNIFASYRISPSVHVSGKWLFGSGFPIPSDNNALRLGDYQRLDVRAEKDWAFHRWKLALYGEMLNLTNHDNRRYFYSSYNPSDGTFSVVTGQGLPVTPTAGVAFEF